MSITRFIAEKMSLYIAGGMSAEAAAGFTRGELSAIYNGNHYGRDSAGEWRQTPPPEILDTATALKKGEAAITAFLSGYSGDPSGSKPDYSETREPIPAYTTERRGIEALRQYTKQGIKLLPCVIDGSRYRPIVKKENWTRTATADIETIKRYTKGGELWTGKDNTGADLRQPITLFRFIPKDYGFIALDIDRGHSDGADGLQNFYNWLETAGIYKPQLPSYLKDFLQFPCYTATPSGGVHLLFKCAEPETRSELDALESANALTEKLTESVEVFYNKPLTAAGSAKQNGDYVLYGSLAEAIELDPILLRRIKKQEKPKAYPVPPQRAAADRRQPYPQQYQKTDLALYKGRLVDYLHAKGYTQKQGEFIPCLCHADGQTPNMFINTDYLYCHSCKKSLDIFGAARIIAGIGQGKKDFPQVIEEVKRALGA